MVIHELTAEDVKTFDEDWDNFTKLFPDNWRKKAYSSGAIERPLRSFKSESDVLRALLLHTAQGYSLRETCAVLKEAKIVDVSNPILLERLQRAEKWLQEMCLDLLAETRLNPPELKPGINLRLFDGTVVSEPGKTGRQWRLHYSFQLPSFRCDHFELTPVKGEGSGESLQRYAVKKNDHIIADRNYSNAAGVKYIDSKGGRILVRVNTSSLPLFSESGDKINLLSLFDEKLTKSGVYHEWTVYVKPKSGKLIKGRLCVMKKTKEAAELSKKKILQESDNRERVKEVTLRYAEFIILFTTFSEEDFSTEEILELYRWRWQIELAFKRLKSLMGFGHLPKRNEQSSRSWIYGKLFIALIVEKLSCSLERLFPPWGKVQGRRTN
jgi:hypothetical protein